MKIPKLHLWIPAFNRFLLLSCIWLILILLLRAADLAGVNRFPAPPLQLISMAVWMDVLTLLGIIRWIVIPYLLLYMLVSRKLADGLYLLLIILYLIISLSLNLYFHQTNVPLGADVYGYSLKDIRQTVGAASGEISLKTIGVLAGIVVLAAVMIVWLSGRKITGDRRGFWFALLCLAFCFVPVSQALTSNRLKPEYAGNIVLNKTGFFLVKTQEYLFPRDWGAEGFIADENGLDPLFRAEPVAPDQYPFLYKPAQGSVLAPFLRETQRPPNIVVVIVEGLGRAFSGKGAYLGSFTPFLDSLSQHSLYWENFLSGGGRTFAVLPSILGSLPFARNGFAELPPAEMPQSLNLLNITARNGYHTCFLYAGDASFDNMEQFVRNQGVTNVVDKDSFGSGYELLPANSGGFTWGYSDAALFRKYLDITPVDTLTPRLDVMLTVSTHSPFKVPDQAHFNQLAENRLRALGLSREQLDDQLQYKSVYASVLYMDNALRTFFHDLAQRPDFNNTIVLVTGDHRLPEIPMRSKIDRYHTLLLMYSPLLQRPATFPSISSHLDIAAAFTGLLQRYPGFAVPAFATWMGSGLDTAREFRNVHHYPLMQTKNDLVDYVYGTWMLNNGSLFKILPNMDLEPSEDESMTRFLNAGFNAFRQQNNRMLQTGRLLPDSLYNAFMKK